MVSLAAKALASPCASVSAVAASADTSCWWAARSMVAASLVPHPVEIILQALILKVFGRAVLHGLILQVVALLEFLGESLSKFLLGVEVLGRCIPLEHHVPNIELGPFLLLD